MPPILWVAKCNEPARWGHTPLPWTPTARIATAANSVASPVAGAVVAHDLHVVPPMQWRQPSLRAAGLAAAHDDVAAAGFQRGRTVAWFPADRDQSRAPRVAGAALLRNERQTDLFHASIQTHCRRSRRQRVGRLRPSRREARARSPAGVRRAQSNAGPGC